jgi:thiol:disulfide interchange protein DsbD
LQRAGEISGGRGGLAGSALTGVLAIVVATPCTAPFMAGAVGYALVQPPLVALAVFLSLAVGFAAPFTLVSFIPALAGRLPRPGAWMSLLKTILALPMLGAAAWLAWVLERQAGQAALAALLVCFTVLLVAAWLYGLAQRRQFADKPYKGLLAAALALFVLSLMPLARLAMPMPPPVTASAPQVWSPRAVAANRGKGRAIFVNFSAAWCITCQVNDRAALSTAAVKAAMARTGTLYLIADSTKYNADIEKALAEFGRGGLPLYVVYPADGSAPKVLPQLLSPGIVISALDAAAGRKS